MLGLVVAFQQHLAELRHGVEPDAAENPLLESALKQCQDQAGERWDPKLVEMLSLMVKGLQQGLSLPTLPTKVTLGSGLIDPEVADSSTVSKV
jgi:hypothetical protein